VKVLNLKEGINDISRKHRAAILFISLCIFFVEPNVKLTLGKASLAGLGMSIEPVQVIPVGLVLLFALIYRLIAFWVIILTDIGTDINRAKSSARNNIDPPIPEKPDDQIEDQINETAYNSVFKWRYRRSLWEIILPTIIGLSAILSFTISFLF